MTSTSRALILDTDIGSDVDDAMALALILGRPDLDLLGVTTVYGDTLLRARLAQRYAGLAGRRITVCAGIEEPLSGRDVWWAGHEGSLHGDLHKEPVSTESAVTFLTRTVAERPGEVDVVAIGPLTNIAAALDADPAFENNVRALWVMGGRFTKGEPEHNFRSDAIAARRVFRSAIPTTVSGLDITSAIQVDQEHIGQLAAAGPLGAALSRDIDQWWRYWDTPWNVPHDPVTVLSLAEPDMFELSPPGHIEVDTVRGEGEGASTFAVNENGRARIVSAVDSPAVVNAMIAAMCSAGRV